MGLTSCASSIGQEAAGAALAEPARDDLYIDGCVEGLKRKRDLVVAALRGMEGVKLGGDPQGAFYVFPDVSGLMGKRTQGGAIIETSHDLALHLLQDYSVALVPGEGFGFTRTLRISYATAVPTLQECMKRMSTCFASLV